MERLTNASTFASSSTELDLERMAGFLHGVGDSSVLILESSTVSSILVADKVE